MCHTQNSEVPSTLTTKSTRLNGKKAEKSIFGKSFSYLCLCFDLLRTFKYKKLATLTLIIRTKGILKHYLGNTDDFCSMYQLFSIFYAQTQFPKQVRKHD